MNDYDLSFSEIELITYSKHECLSKIWVNRYSHKIMVIVYRHDYYE